MTAILTSVALIGPMQVADRIVLMCFSARLETREIGAAVVVLLPAAILPLLFLAHTPVWLGLSAALYGAGDGIMTIARGTAVADLIGRTHYGAINGALTLPTMVAKALATDFSAFVGIHRSEECRLITRAHVIPRRKDFERRRLAPSIVRRKLSALSSLFEYKRKTVRPGMETLYLPSMRMFSMLGSTKPRRNL